MTEYDATEIAYKNGYTDGLRDGKPKKGEWIAMSDSDGNYYCCSRCGEELPRYSLEKATYSNPFVRYFSIEKTSFCPNCGADNRR